MKKYILSEKNWATNEYKPLKVYNSYKSFNQGIINNFKEMVENSFPLEEPIENRIVYFEFKFSTADGED